MYPFARLIRLQFAAVGALLVVAAAVLAARGAEPLVIVMSAAIGIASIVIATLLGRARS